MSAAKNTNSRQHNLADIREDIKSTPRVGRFVSGLSSITKFVRRMVSARTIPVTTGSCGRNNSDAWKPGYWNAKRVFASLALLSELITVALYNGSVNFSSLLAVQPAQAASGIAKMVNYQGRLMNASGNAVTDGTYAIKFTIYNSLNNGTQLWSANTANGLPTGSPVAVNVTVKNGLFSVLLGDTSAGQVAFPENLFNNDGLYLGVTVGTDSEMKPRKRLSAVPYAYNADALQGQHASATTPSWGGNTFALNQNSTNAATSTRSAFYVHTSGTSNVFDYLIRGNNGSDVFTVNRQGNVTTTGNLEVRGYTKIGDATSDRINVQARFVSDLTPATDNTYSLGTASLRWKNLYASYVSTTNVDALGYVSTTNLYVNGNQITGATPSLQQVTNVGATTNKWIKFSGATSIGDFMPSSTNMYSLGSSNYRWKGVWAAGVTSTWIGAGTVSTSKLYINGSEIGGTPSWQQVTNVGAMTNKWIKFAGATSVGNVMPSSTLTYDLGSSNYRWKDIWASSTRIGTSTWELWQSNVGFTLSRAFAKKLQVTNAGTLLPGSNNAQDIGSSSNSWRNTYASGTSYASTFDSYIKTTPTLAGSLDTAGTAYDAEIHGDYAYVADYSALRVIDISNPSRPTETGSVALTAYDVAVAGDYAYVAGYNSNNISIVDISNPSSPSVVKTQAITGLGYGVAVSGKYLYLANDTTGLKIYDISNPTSPTLIRTITTTGAATDVFVQGDYAYVSAYSAGLDIIDVSNPYAASLVGNYNTAGNAWDVYVSGRYAYVADEGQGLAIVDVKNPASPTLAKAFTSVSNVYGVNVSGNYAYLESIGSALSVVDVSSSTSPVLISQYGSGAAQYGCVKVLGKLAFVCDGTSGVKLFNVAGVNAPTASIGNIATNEITIIGDAKAGQMNTNGLNVAGNALVAGRLGTSATATFMGKVGVGTLTPNYFALQVAGNIGPDAANSYDLGTASMPWRNSYEFTTNNYTTLTPSLVSSLDTAGTANDTFVKGDYAYVADGANFRIINISNPSYPREVGSVAANYAYDVYVAGNYAYVAAYNANAAYIIDISNPTSPQIVSTVAITGTVYGVFVSGKFMYVANDNTGLKIYDISNIASPSLIKTIATNGAATDVMVKDSYAYVSVYGSGLDIINISNPATASIVGNYNTPGAAWDVYVSGRYAYVADEGQGLAIIDIKNPASPTLAKSFASVSNIYGVNVAGDYAYLEGTGSALYVVNVSSSTNPVLAAQYGTGGASYGSVTVYGRSAVVSDGINGIKIFALPGTYTPAAEIGNLSSHDISATGNINANVLNGSSVNISGSSMFGGPMGVYGTTTLRDLVVGRRVASDLLPFSDLTYNLGSSSYRWKGVWAAGVTSTWIGAGTVSTSKLYINGSEIGGTPSWQQVTNVGAMTNKWIKFAGATSVGNIMPSSTATYDSGSSNYRWKDIYTNSLSALPSNSSAYTQVASTNFGTATTYGSDLVGNYLYVTNMPNTGYMNVIDVSIPSSPVQKGSVQVTAASLWSLNVEGNYAYLVDNGGNFYVVDVTNPSVPVKIRTLALGGNPWSSDIHVQGKYVYVPSYGDSHFHIIDVTVPANAYLVSTAGGYQHIAMDVQSDVAYVLSYGSNLLYSYDISNPASPTLLYSTSTGISGTWESLIVEGRYAYGMSSGGQLTIIDVSNPAYMRNVATASGLGGVTDGGSKMHFDGKYLYVPSNSNYVRIIDVSNPSNLSSLTVATTFSSNSVNVSGRYMYVNGTSGGLKVFDVRGAEVNGLLAHSAEMGTLQVRNDSVFNGNVMMNEGVRIGLGGLYVESGLVAASTSTILGGMSIGTGSKTANDYFRLNVAGHVGPSTTNMYDLGSSSYRWRNLWANNVTSVNVYASGVVSTSKLYVNGQQITPSAANPFVQNGNTFTASGTLGTNDAYPLVFETNNTSRIKLTSATISSLQPVTHLGADLGDTGHRWRDVWASSTRIGTSTWELWQSNTGFTLSKAFSKKFVINNAGAVLPGAGNAQDLGIGSMAWRNINASGTASLNSIWSKAANISNPDSNSITEVGSITLGGTGEGPSVVQGNYLYRTGDGNSTYLYVYDLSVPTSPSSTARLNLGHYTSGLRVSGRYAIASYTGLFSVIDISNPKSPVLLSTTNIGGNDYKGLDVANGYVYTLDNQAGTLKIYDITNPYAPAYVGSVTTNGTNPRSVVVQGRYAYVANTGSNTMSVIDVSNPAAPTFVSTSTVSTGPVTIAVQGRYVYTGHTSSNNFTITDVMAPTNTKLVATLNLGGTVNSNYLQALTVHGRYAYIGLTNNTLKVIDVVNPFSPTIVASKALSSYGVSPVVNGKYLYMTVYGGKLSVFDLGGIETNSMLAHTLNAGNLNVSTNANIARLNTDSAMIGVGGLAIEGRLSAMATSTLQNALPATSNSFDLGSASLAWRNIYFDGLTQAIPVGSTFSQINSVQTGTSKGPYDVKVIGRYAYVANGYGDTVSILDVTLPTSTALLGSVTVTGEPNKIEVRGKYAYVTSRAGDRLTIIDVSDVRNPFITGYITGMGNPIGLAVSGNYAYVGDSGGTKGVTTVNISNPYAPSFVTSTYVTSNPPQDLYVQGDYLYAVLGSSSPNIKFAIYHIADPSAPVLVDTLTLNYAPKSLEVQGRYAYISSPSGYMTVVDVTSSTAATLVKNHSLASQPSCITVQGKYAYISHYSSPGRLTVVNIADPANPQTITSFNTGSYAIDLTVAGRYLYVADYGSYRLNIYDIKGVEFNGLVANSGELGTLQVRNNAYVANQMSIGGGLTVDGAGIYSNGSITMQGWEMRQLTDGSFALGKGNYTKMQVTSAGTIKSLNPQPSRVSGVNLSTNGATDVKVVGKYAYIATSNAIDNNEDLQVYDVSNPSYPVKVGGIDLVGSTAKSITVVGNYAYIGAYDSGLGVGFGIYDISDPKNIAKKSFTSFGWNSEYPYEIRVVGKYAYMVTGGTFSRFFKIYDISNPSAPVQVYTTGMAQWTYGLDVEGNFAYIGDGGGNLMIYNVKNPASASLVKTITLPGSHSINQLEVVGTKAYIASYDADGSTKDMVIYDVSSSTNPVYNGGVNVGGGATVYSVQVANNYAFLSTNQAGYGMTVVDVSSSTNPVITSGTGSYNNNGKMYVSGKYAYYTVNNEPTYQQDFLIFDIGGMESPTANFGAIRSENLDVSEDANINRLNAKLAHIGLGGIFTNGSLQVTATGTVTDLVVSRHVGSDLMPWASQTYSLGDSTHQWKNAFFSGTVTTTKLYVNGTLITGSTPNLQQVTTAGYVTTNPIRVAGVSSTQNILPTANGTLDLGNSSYRWKSAYLNNVSSTRIDANGYVSTTRLTVNGNTTLGDATGDLLTINGNAVTIPNSLNFDANTLIIDSANNDVTIGGKGYVWNNLDVGDGMITPSSTGKAILLSTDGGDTFLETRSTDSSEGLIMHGNGEGNYGLIRNMGGAYAAHFGGAAGLYLFTEKSSLDDSMMMLTAGTERMRISEAGNIGINDTTPTEGKLVLAGSSNTPQLFIKGAITQKPNQPLIVLATSTGSTITTITANTADSFFVGPNAGSKSLGNGAGSYFIGNNAGANVTSGYWNVAIGSNALRLLTTNGDNVAVGNFAAEESTGQEATAIGHQAMRKTTTGNFNTAVGSLSLFSNTTGYSNTAVGYGSLYNNKSATSTVAFGYYAGFGAPGYSSQNGVYIGSNAGYSLTTGSNANTMVGHSAGYNNTSGANNVYLGYQSGANVTTGSNNVIIGFNVSAPKATGSYQLNIANNIYGDLSNNRVGIGVPYPYTAKLVVAGDVYPSSTNAYDLGSTNYRWRNLWATNATFTSLYVNGAPITPAEYFKQNGNSFGTTAVLGTNDSNHLVVETNNTSRLMIYNTGNVGVGTDTPDNFKLEVAGNVGPDASLSYDLGSSSYRWKDLWVSSTYIGGSTWNIRQNAATDLVVAPVGAPEIFKMNYDQMTFAGTDPYMTIKTLDDQSATLEFRNSSMQLGYVGFSGNDFSIINNSGSNSLYMGTGGTAQMMIGTTSIDPTSNDNITLGESNRYKKLNAKYVSTTLLTATESRHVPSNTTGFTQLNAMDPGNTPYQVVVKGRYTYIANSPTAADIMIIADAENATNASTTGSISLGLSAIMSIAVDGNYLYAMTGPGTPTLHVVDVSDPSKPIAMSWLSNVVGSYYGTVVASAGYVYLTDYATAGLKVVKVTDPARPVVVASITGLGNGPQGAVKLGNYVYTANYSGQSISAIDVTNPEAPVLKSTMIGLGQNLNGITAQGRYAYVPGQSGNLAIVDISSSTAMKRVKTVALGAGTQDWYTLSVSGRYVYVPLSNSTVAVVDVQYPSSASVVGTLPMASAAYSTYVNGRYLYAVNQSGASKLKIFDIRGVETNGLLAHSAEVGSLQVDGEAIINSMLELRAGLTVSDLATFQNGMNIYGDTEMFGGLVNKPMYPDITNPYSGIPMGGVTKRVMVQGNYEYILGNAGNTFYIYDISNQTSTRSVVSFTLPVSMQDMYINGQYAYFSYNAGTLYGRRLYIYDIANPSNPTLVSAGVSSNGNNGGADGIIKTYGTRLYTAGNYAGTTCSLAITDISDPREMRGFSEISVSASYTCADLVVRDRYAYLLTNHDLYKYDISNPKSPSLIGSVSRAGFTPYSIDINGQYLYLWEDAGSNNGYVRAYEITNTGLTLASSLSLVGSGKAQIKVLDNYVYVLSKTTTSGAPVLHVVDASNPASIKSAYSKDLSTLSQELSVFDIAGDTLYAGSEGLARKYSINLKGIESHAASIGSLESHRLNVKGRADIDGVLNVFGGITLGGTTNMNKGGSANMNGSAFHDITTQSPYNNYAITNEVFSVVDGRDLSYSDFVDTSYVYKTALFVAATGTYTLGTGDNGRNVGIAVSVPGYKNTGAGMLGVGVFSHLNNGGDPRANLPIMYSAAGHFSVDSNISTAYGLLVNTTNNNSVPTALFNNGSSGTNARTLVLQQACLNTTTPIFEIFGNTGGDREFYVRCDGATYADGSYFNTGADYAEYMKHSNVAFVPGDVAVLDLGNASSVAMSAMSLRNKVVGVISGHASVLGNTPKEMNSNDPIDTTKWTTVGMLGQVPTKFSDANGQVEVGDKLMAGENGYAVKAVGPGMVIGEALESISTTGTIVTYLHPHWWAGDILEADGSINYLTNDLTLKKQDDATVINQGFNSTEFTFQGSGWDSSSQSAVTTNFKLYNHTVNATTSEMVIGFATGTNGITNYGLRITNLGDVSVSGKLYLGSKKYGVASTSTYMFVDDVLSPTSTYIATNADGWETQNTYDYAERYESAEQLVPGDLVVADPSGINKVMRATNVTQALLGIVSTKPGFVTGRHYEGNYPIALAGRVPTRVSTANGSINVGDYLTVQEGNSGVAVKAIGAGNVVGIALESYDKVEEGLISVFVKPGYTMGSIAQSGSQTIIQTVQSVPTTQRVEIEGLASILAGATEVHVSYNTILAFPMAYATPHASIDGSWWIANRTDKGFDIVISQAQTHDVDFTWMARPMRAGTVRFVSDNTHQTVDDLTGQPYGPQLSDVIAPTSTTSTAPVQTPSDGVSTTGTGTSTDSGITIDFGTTTTTTNIQTQANSSSTTSS